MGHVGFAVRLNKVKVEDQQGNDGTLAEWCSVESERSRIGFCRLCFSPVPGYLLIPDMNEI